MNRNITLAAAIAAALAAGSAGATTVAQPSAAQAQNPDVALYVAGSSAAKGAFLNVVENQICAGAGNYSLFSSTGNTNFAAVSCNPQSSSGISTTEIVTVWLRVEGGSVTGALPLVSGSSINQLSLTGAAGSSGSYTVAVSGNSASNGIDDSFGGGVFKAPVQFGITDVEPGALIKNNYPSAYLQSVYGKATAVQLAGLSATPLFDQVFGVFVNTNSTAFASKSLSISKQAIGGVLQGASFDNNWSKITDTGGSAVASSLGITIINREQGSGSRTATDLFFTNDQCVAGQKPIKESTAGTADYFSTGNVLAAANTVPGSITYASIDNNNGSYPNLSLVAIDGVAPSALAAASGAYGDWFELTGVTGSNFNSLSGDVQTLIGDLESDLQTSPPAQTDIMENPNFNAASLPISGTGSPLVNPFTRGGQSCNDPANTI